MTRKLVLRDFSVVASSDDLARKSVINKSSKHFDKLGKIIQIIEFNLNAWRNDCSGNYSATLKVIALIDSRK